MKTDDARVVVLGDLPVAGVQYHQSKEDLDDYDAGQKLVLVREPNNAHDRHAVRVDNTLGEKVGYIPRSHSQIVAALLDGGLQIDACIGECAPRARLVTVVLTWRSNR